MDAFLGAPRRAFREPAQSGARDAPVMIALARQTHPMYPESEILFPARSIPELRQSRKGEKWQKLIDRLAALPETHEDVLAFCLMMIRLGNCLTCDLDSYRASLGCTACARRTVSSFKGGDDALLRKMEEARKELEPVLKIERKPARRK